ncbi:acyl-CoA desaturase [Halioglobus japonicus]|uniref:Acyl-CoA desaturase n=1 Tax=Halioglobus japonicus TaxID=930805 RepID=A0AAP8MBA0_9GAMM|nr:fatty acid desaturase [Halioglobus japonicus]AQA20005.1 acyl-CoA desaturase [Halioglobus japonicus]PLW84623.1 acyl-CoA desaturase [Halioglobus japonicus]GHD22723.1 acyl-CoA desaturase [Halioglobus japonicus]
MSNPNNKPPLDKINVAVFVGLPLIALLAVPAWGIYHGYSLAQWLWALAFLYLNGMSITGGYHRLWSHKAYEAHPALKWFYALWGAGALQNSILIWASDHRRHHRHVDDNEQDPYSAGRGLWFSHMGWMLREYRTNEQDFSNAKDLQRDSVVMFQHNHYVALTTFMNVGLPLLLGLYLGDVIGTLLLVGLFRLIVNHHVTFFINSLAHFWGTRPYTETNSARDNGFLAFLTYGEGYHNYHHIFQTDYRNGIRWWQWDPTKWLINGCSRVGLASKLVRVPEIKIQRAMLDTQFKRARAQLDETESSDTLRDKLEREYQQFTESVNEWTTLQAQRYEAKKAELGGALGEKRARLQQKWETATLRTKFKELEYSLKMQRKRMELLMKEIQLQAQMQPA